MGALIEKLSRLLGAASIVVLVVTLAALPWLLGGVIPLARFVLLAGSLIAAGLSLLASLLDRNQAFIPLLLLPLIGIASLGLWQLQPIDAPLLHGMQSALHPIPDGLAADREYVGSLSPDETRSTVALYLSLCLIALVGANMVQSQRTMAIVVGIMILNAVLVSSVGFIELFDPNGLALNKRWLISDNVTAHAFSTFINPNNAAGWLCLGFACATGWAAYLMKRSSTQGAQKYGRLNTSRWEQVWQRTAYFLADLTHWQIFSAICVVFLAAAVLATQSRGGFIALVFGTLLVLGLRSSVRALPGILFAFVICGLGIFALLRWMDVDSEVVGEIESLKNVQVSTDTRIVLWSDSLNITRDFPITGTGLGTYKYAILPYQSRETRLWFRNADNQFVEMLVEGGIVGFLLMIAVGIVGVLTSIAATRQRHHRSQQARVSGPIVSRRFLSAIGLVAGLTTLTQAFSGMFDFGIALPAASSLMVLILAACCGFLAQSDRSGGVLHRVALPCPRILLLAFYLAPAWFGVDLLQDQWNAVQLDKSLVTARQLLRKPVTPESLRRIPDELDLLQERLECRPDDNEANRVVMWLNVARFRYEVMQADDPVVDQRKNFNDLWGDTTLFAIVRRLSDLRTEDPYLRLDWLQQLAEIGGRLQLPETLRQVQQRCPLIPHLAEERARLDAIFELGEQESLFEKAVFVRPASTSLWYELGLLATANKKYEQAQDYWRRSLQLGERHRGDILEEVQQFSSVSKALEAFAPTSYAGTAQAALSSKDSELAAALWGLADEQWAAQEPPTDEVTCLLRGKHLLQKGERESAITWLQSCLDNAGDNLKISLELAMLLEKEERYKEALQQWSRIQYHDPDNVKAAEAVARIYNLD